MSALPDAVGLRPAVGLALTLVVLGCTTAPRPTARPIGPDPASWTERPYSPDSVWNTPIGQGAAVDPHSERLTRLIERPLTSDPAQYTFTLYIVDGGTPRHRVATTKYEWTLADTAGRTIRTPEVDDVPIPADARPSAGTDGQMILIDPAGGREYDLWQAERTRDGWRVAGGSVYNIRGDAEPTEYGSRGAGIPYLAGLVRPWEIAAGRIDHAIAFATQTVRRGRCVWPASKTDGKSRKEFALPQGARLQLDPELRDEDLTALGLDRAGKIIAKALQTYGMILVDSSGRTKIYVENLADNPYSSLVWDAEGLGLESDTVAGIPIDRFRVLALPPGYWDGTARPTHGDCVGGR